MSHTTGGIIRALGLGQVPMLTPEQRRAAARQAARSLTPAARRALAESNGAKYADMRARMQHSAYLMGQSPGQSTGRSERRDYAPSQVCPRCGEQARGATEGQRIDWFGEHFNSAHGGH